MEAVGCLFSKALPIIWRIFSRVKCRSKLNGIVIPIGKSTMVKGLQPHDSKMKLLDLEASVLLDITREDAQRLQELKDKGEVQTYEQKFAVLAKSHVENLQHNFPKNKFILVASSLELLKYVGCRNDDIVSFAPSNSFWSQIKDTISDNVQKGVYELARQNLIINNKSLNVFSTFEELFATASRIFNLKAKL